MAESKIEWTEQTWNVCTGCTRVSSGCDHCYSARMSRRLEGMGQAKYFGINGRGHFNGVVRTHDDALSTPLKRQKPTVWFVNSMSDLFHPSVPFEFIDRVFAVMALTPQHTYQVLTKRPERAAEYLNQPLLGFRWLDACEDDRSFDRMQELDDGKGYLPNVWLGTSVEDQQAADERIPHLLRCPAAVRFLSCEPLLGAVEIVDDLGNADAADRWHWCDDDGNVIRRGERDDDDPDVQVLGPHTTDLEDDDGRKAGRCCYECDWIAYDGEPRIHWVIAGGESGPGARPCRLDWLRSLRDQCRAAGVPYFLKQLGRDPVKVVDCFVCGGDRYIEGERCRCCDVNGQQSSPLKLDNSKGGDMDEWPEDLRVRDTPRTEAKA